MAKNKKGTYKSPNIQYYQSRGDFNIAVGEDFIHAINDLSSNEPMQPPLSFWPENWFQAST